MTMKDSTIKLSKPIRDMEPLVSVITPVFNCEKYVGEAIKSVLSQSYRNVQLIVVNDGSTDKSEQVIRQFSKQIKYLKKPHSGIGPTMNLGLSHATGEYLSFLDADDVWPESKLQLQLQTFMDSDADLIFGHMQQYLSPELDVGEFRNIVMPTSPLPGYVAGTMFTTKAIFEKVGAFPEHYEVGQFVDWYLRTKEKGLQNIMMEETLLNRRIHQTNTTRKQGRKNRDYLSILKAGIDRRRTIKRSL